jgi:hypothetical protein
LAIGNREKIEEKKRRGEEEKKKKLQNTKYKLQTNHNPKITKSQTKEVPFGHIVYACGGNCKLLSGKIFLSLIFPS